MGFIVMGSRSLLVSARARIRVMQCFSDHVISNVSPDLRSCIEAVPFPASESPLPCTIAFLVRVCGALGAGTLLLLGSDAHGCSRVTDQGQFCRGGSFVWLSVLTDAPLEAVATPFKG